MHIFLISNKSSVENEKYFMVAMVNTKYLNKLHGYQIEDLKGFQNSRIEDQCVNP